MTKEDNIRGLAMALDHLCAAVVTSGGQFSLEGAGAITQSLKQAYAAIDAHQTWLLSDRH